MALEDLTGTKYVADLNEVWPLGSDLPNAGDDHIRGIKNVLKRQFPNLGRAPVTLTADTINRGSIPLNTYLIIIAVSAPTGWTRDATVPSTRMLRIVPSPTQGFGWSGSDDPILNDKTPYHNHGINLYTQNNNVRHKHFNNFATTEAGYHLHYLDSGASGGAISNKPFPFPPGDWNADILIPNGGGLTTSVGNHVHWVYGYSETESTDHQHVVFGLTETPIGASPWTPRFLDGILCWRSS